MNGGNQSKEEIEMPITKALTAKDVEGIKPQEFVATTNFGTLSGDDLYWLLYRAASETGSGGSFDTFDSKVQSLLTDRLGAGRYGLTLVTGSGPFEFINTLLPNNLCWCGEQGVLPGFGSTHGVYCFVWWN